MINQDECPATQIGQIAKEEGAECYLCTFSDNFDNMVRTRLDGEGDEVWCHQECLEENV